MQPGTHNIVIVRGEDYSLSFNVTVDSVVQTFTGGTAYAQIRESESRASTLIADFTTAIDVAGEVTITLSDTLSAAITQDLGYYDVVIRDSGGNDVYYLKGRVTVDGSVTVIP